MFDDVKKEDQNLSPSTSNTPVPPAQNLPVDDMFQETDPSLNKAPLAFTEKPSAISSGKIQPASPVPAVPVLSSEQAMTNSKLLLGEENTGSNVKKIIVAGVGLVLVTLVAWGAYSVFFSSSDQNVVDETKNTNQVQNNQNNTQEQNNAELPVNNEAVDVLANDDDKDGLSNAQEDASGTDPNNPDTDDDALGDKDEIKVYLTDPLNADTDNDGLFDNEELSVWKTDPLKSDSDGDLFIDGIEVANGYNPLGEGLLVSPPNPRLITQ